MSAHALDRSTDRVRALCRSVIITGPRYVPSLSLEAMNAAAISPSPSPVEAEVRRIRALLEQNQFAAALGAAEALAVTVPENRDVLYMMAVSQRYLNRIPDALA